MIKRSALVGLGALVLSTIAIQASDYLRGIESNLSGLAIDGTSQCLTGEVHAIIDGNDLCVDIYEASASESCPHENPLSIVHTQENANDFGCMPASKDGVEPWRFVSFTQAQQLCARSGKRLLKGGEWFVLASGIADESKCAINSRGVVKTGSTECVSPTHVMDLVGNVWEWVDEEIVNGEYNGRTLPEDGYVSLVDTKGVVIETLDKPQSEFGNDYAWTDASGVRGMIRGGFYGSGDDAGVFAQNMSVPLDHKTAGVGFRCVRDL